MLERIQSGANKLSFFGWQYCIIANMIELRHLDVRHFVTEECSIPANGCATKCGCLGLMLFHYLSCMGAIVCAINTIGFVSVYARRV